jgi:hypothetical protein
VMSDWSGSRVCRHEIYARAGLTPFPTPVTYWMSVIACHFSFSTGLKGKRREKELMLEKRIYTKQGKVESLDRFRGGSEIGGCAVW